MALLKPSGQDSLGTGIKVVSVGLPSSQAAVWELAANPLELILPVVSITFAYPRAIVCIAFGEPQPTE